MKLEPGLWERLVSRALSEAIGAESELQAQTEPLDPADAPIRIAQYVGPLVERSMRALGGQRADDQLRLTNAIVDLLRSSVPAAFDGDADDIEAPSRVLESLTRRGGFMTGSIVQRPSVPLSDTALLTNAPGEPSVGYEIGREIASADDVDLLCAFLSGVPPSGGN